MKNAKSKFYSGSIKMNGVILLILGFIVMLAVFVPISSYNKSCISYDDCVYKKYTVVKVEERKGKVRFFQIQVREEENGIRFEQTLNRTITKSDIMDLKENDVIYVYLNDLHPVEIKTEDSDIFSLEDYKEAFRKNSVAGFIFVPVIVVLLFASGIIFLCKKRS